MGRIGIIGGSGLYDIEGLKNKKPQKVSTPFGEPSDVFIVGELEGQEVVFLPRHGRGHKVLPSELNYRANIFGMAAEIEPCDRLIMESTYADPEYRFPDNFEVYESLSKWVRENDRSNLLIGAYEMGKAQEMVKVLNEYCGLAPIVTEKAEKICRVYERFGIKLDRAVVGSDEAEELMDKRFVAVVPMRHAKRYFANNLACAFGRETLVAVATGWALKYRFNADAAFPISDHADFNDLLHYAEGTGAKEIEFFEGDGSKLVSALKNKIINPLLNK